MNFAKKCLNTYSLDNKQCYYTPEHTTLQKLMKMPLIIQEKHLFQQRKLNFVG